MCTLIALHRCVPGVPLVVAANRDEFLDRPSEGPRLRVDDRGVRSVAPRDVRAGGTWLGINEYAVFAALTNRSCPEPDPSMMSRGDIVTRALGARTAAEAARAFAQLPADAFNPFNAFVADSRDAFVAVYDRRPELQPLAPGAHVVGNVDPNDRANSKVGRVLARSEAAVSRSLESVRKDLQEICSEHEAGGARGSLDDTCVHSGAYGTRSSTLFELHDHTPTSRLLFAEGPPCRAEYRDFTDLLRELSPQASYDGGEEPTRKAS